MKNIGTYVMIFGAGSILLNLFGYNFKLLMWVDEWGEGSGWAIRIGIFALGAILFALGMQKQKADQGTPPVSQESGQE